MTSCASYQTAISALVDGEEPGVELALVERHLARCAACREFRRAAHSLGRSALMAEAPRMPDLSRSVMKRQAVADRAGTRGVVRFLLAAVAIEMIVAALPALVLGRDGAITSHEARHLGAFSVAFAVGLMVVVIRPARARAMLPVAMVLVGGLLITTVIDLIDGHAKFLAETAHIPGFFSVLFVWLLARSPLAAVDVRFGDPSVARPLRAVEHVDPHSEVG